MSVRISCVCICENHTCAFQNGFFSPPLHLPTTSGIVYAMCVCVCVYMQMYVVAYFLAIAVAVVAVAVVGYIVLVLMNDPCYT